MLYRNPFLSPQPAQGEDVIDHVSDALVTVALARGAEVVEASIGWYDRCCVALHEAPEEMTEAILRAGYEAARERLRDLGSADETAVNVSQMESLVGMLAAAFHAGSPIQD